VICSIQDFKTTCFAFASSVKSLDYSRIFVKIEYLYYTTNSKEMKFLLKSLFVLAMLSTATLIVSCSSKEKAPEKIESIDKSGPEYTSEYVCPMHCKGTGSEAPGKCPVCSMSYVLNKERSHEGHDHSKHDGHDHGDHDGHNH